MEGKIPQRKKKKPKNYQTKKESHTKSICASFLPVIFSGAPAGLKYSEVRDGLLAVRGVTAVHNLHIWALTANQAVLTAHVAIGEEELGAVLPRPAGLFLELL